MAQEISFAAMPTGADRDAAQLVQAAFAAWSTGTGSIYDLMDAGTEIVLPGTSPNCGAFRKDAFLRDIAVPFVARFAEPPVPQLRDLWSNARGVVATADATATTRDGRPYANAYVFIFEFSGTRVARVTEFLDMAAFEAVWNGVEA